MLGRSSIWRTAPLAPPRPSPPDFYNAAVRGSGPRSRPDLLFALLAIERRFGRARSTPNAPRTLDLDILSNQGVVVEGKGSRYPTRASTSVLSQ